MAAAGIKLATLVRSLLPSASSRMIWSMFVFSDAIG
jgi:hypothetical protein